MQQHSQLCPAVLQLLPPDRIHSAAGAAKPRPSTTLSHSTHSSPCSAHLLLLQAAGTTLDGHTPPTQALPC
jgi:hypothetical protein